MNSGNKFDHDDPKHVYSPKGNPSGCDKFYCLSRFDADGWYGVVERLRTDVIALRAGIEAATGVPYTDALQHQQAIARQECRHSRTSGRPPMSDDRPTGLDRVARALETGGLSEVFERENWFIVLIFAIPIVAFTTALIGYWIFGA